MYQLQHFMHLCQAISSTPTIFPWTAQRVQFAGRQLQVCVPDVHEVMEFYSQHPTQAFWSKLWPSAFALCRFMAEHSQELTGKRVWELAAGLGLPSLLAAHWAQSVVCTEQAAEAIPFIEASAAINKIENLHAAALCWDNLPEPLPADIVLMSDVNYDPEQFPALAMCLQHLLDQRLTIWLSTPQRLMAKPFIEALLPHCIHREEIILPDVPASNLPPQVWVLKK